jgi:hypothetical protein
MWWEIQAHIQENVVAYGVGAAILIPAVIFARKYLISYLWWPMEFLAYVVGFHVLVKAIVFCAGWFKVSTRMYWESKTATGWQTPLYKVWDMQAYNPQWVFYLEMTVFALMLFFMIRYRPMVVQKAGPRREHLSKGRAGQVRPQQAQGTQVRSR